MKQFGAAVAAAFSMLACASTAPYPADYPLTEATFASRDGSFTGKIPLGWFSSTEDSLANALTAWLIKEDYSAILAVKEIKLDRLATERVQKEGLILLAQINASMEGASQLLHDLKEFEMAKRKYAGYEQSAGETTARIVVFTGRGKFYSCTARTVKGTWSRTEIAEMFRAQQTLLASLMF